MPRVAEVPFVCPRCRGPLEAAGESLACRGECLAIFPVVAGIPDLRVCADPYIGLAEDRAKGLRLLEEGAGLSFAGLVELYYRITPEVPPVLAARYAAHHLAGKLRGEGLLQRVAAHGLSRAASNGAWLEVGCGSGGFLAAAGGAASVSAGAPLSGIDIAFRWLVLARKRLEEEGLAGRVTLVAACGDHLPFPDGAFSLVAAEGVLEHVERKDVLLRECLRVRRRGGALLARTVNRFAAGPEPHVWLMMLGYLPRPWQDPYVRWRRGTPYTKIHLPSYGSLSQLLRKVGHSDLEVRAPRFSDADLAWRPPQERKLLELYRGLLSNRALNPLLARVGPFLDVVGPGDAARDA